MNRIAPNSTSAVCRRHHRARVARRGLIMPLVLIAMGISMILGIAFLTSASQGSATASVGADRLNARMIAESGIAVALAAIDSDPAWRVLPKKAQWVAAQPLGGGTFSIDVEDGDQVDATGKVIGDGKLDDDDQDPVVITCTGTYGKAKHRVRAVRRVPIPTGIAVQERVSLRKNALIDSYDTALPYNAITNSNAKAVASSNGISRKPYILLYGTSRVNGDVYHGPGGSLASSIKQDATAVVTGTIGPLPMSVDRPDVVEPIWPGASVGDRAYSSGVTTLTSDLWCDRLTLNSTAILRIIGDVKLRVDDNMLVTDDARIQLGAPIAYAAATKANIDVTDAGALVDSFDSSLGTYGGTNVGDAALATNSTTAASAMIQFATVKGNVFAGVGSNPATSIINVGGTITGKTAALITPLVIPAAPVWPGVGANQGNYDRSTGSTSTINANAQYDRIRLDSDAVVQVSGKIVLRVNKEFVVDNTARLEILPNSSLTVYVGEQIQITGSAQVNVNSGDASRLVIFGMGAGYTHTIDGTASAYAVVDAPTSTLRVLGDAQLFGAFMGNIMSVRNNGKLHLDRNPALATACPRLPSTFTTGNKLTLYTQKALTVAKNARFNCDAPDPQNVQIYHLAGEPFRVIESANGYGQIFVRENLLEFSGNSRWTGQVKTRDLKIANTAVVTTSGAGGSTDPGILVEETAEIRDSAVINPSGPGAALLASHGATDTTIYLEQKSVFKGDCYTTPGGYPNDEIRVGSMATLTGIKAALKVPVDLNTPPSPTMIGSPADRTYNGNSVTVLSGDVYAKNFTAKDDATIEIDGVTRIILSGDFRFSKRAKLKLRPYAKLTVFCPGWVLFEDDVQVNFNGSPSRVTVACTGTNYRILFVVDDAKVCGTILAPAADLLVWDRAEYFGAYRGKRLIMDKDSKFHCSEDGPVPITWLEQQ